MNFPELHQQKRGVPRIKICYELDANSILTVTAEVEGHNGKKESLKIDKNKGSLSQREIEEMVKDAEKNREADEKVRKTIEAKTKLESFINAVKNVTEDSNITALSPEEKKELGNEVTKYQSWLESNDKSTLEEYESQYKELEQFYSKYSEKLYPQQQEQQKQHSQHSQHQGKPKFEDVDVE